MVDKSILFYRHGSPLTFEQRVGIKNYLQESLEEAGLAETIKPIVLHESANVNMFDGDLGKKLAALADHIQAHTDAMNNLANVMIAALGIEDDAELQEQKPQYLDG